MKTRKEIWRAFAVLDSWFDSPGRKPKSEMVLNQIRGAHVALAWLLGADYPGERMEDNIERLKQEISE